MPEIKMLVDVSGTRDGKDWPRRGEIAEVSSDEAKHLIGAGLAVAADEPLAVEETFYVNQNPPASDEVNPEEASRVPSPKIPPTAPGDPQPEEADSDKRLADAEAEVDETPTPAEAEEDAETASETKAGEPEIETAEAPKPESRPRTQRRKG